MFTALVQLTKSFLSTLPLFFLLSLVALVLSGRTKWGQRLLIGLYLALYLGHLEPVVQLLRFPLESYSFKITQTHLQQKKADAIVVLGGGLKLHGSWHSPSLSLDSLARTVKAAALSLQNQGLVPIIASGLGSLGSPTLASVSEAFVMRETLKELNVEHVWLEDTSHTTYENALKTKALLNQRKLWYEGFPILLVTSALHLPRATATFQKQGFTVLPVASHFTGSSNFTFSLKSLVPTSLSFHFLEQALHEYFGFIYYKITLKI